MISILTKGDKFDTIRLSGKSEKTPTAVMMPSKERVADIFIEFDTDRIEKNLKIKQK